MQIACDSLAHHPITETSMLHSTLQNFARLRRADHGFFSNDYAASNFALEGKSLNGRNVVLSVAHGGPASHLPISQCYDSFENVKDLRGPRECRV